VTFNGCLQSPGDFEKSKLVSGKVYVETTMGFFVFEEYGSTAGTLLRKTSETFKLAGYNLLHQAWEARGKPLDEGWQVSREELVRLRFPNETASSKRLIIDFDPNADWRIGLIEPLVIYAFSFGGDNQTVTWTPLMIKLRDVFYREYEPVSRRRHQA
jgi:hypothetical protein